AASVARADEPSKPDAREAEIAEHELGRLKATTGGFDTNKKVDTTYGRIDGDIGLAFGAGITLAPRAPRLAADFRLRYMDTIGAWVTYEEGPLIGSSSDPRRVFASGLEIRPLFLARWLQGWELGSPRLDLAIDSIGLELGAFLAQPEGARFGSRPGFQLGLGLEVPIFEKASGPWIGFHGGARWSDTALGGGVISGPSDRSLFLSITVRWHFFLGTHVVDVGDRAPQ
ncbi:MAG: hypothetical protein JWM74_4903, partial [Myxococcaceae bacterium]|nr:hypothetical protein [Myxococcaceae bacterium]